MRDLRDSYRTVDDVAFLLSTWYAPGPGNLSGSSNVVVIAQSGMKSIITNEHEYNLKPSQIMNMREQQQLITTTLQDAYTALKQQDYGKRLVDYYKGLKAEVPSPVVQTSPEFDFEDMVRREVQKIRAWTEEKHDVNKTSSKIIGEYRQLPTSVTTLTNDKPT